MLFIVRSEEDTDNGIYVTVSRKINYLVTLVIKNLLNQILGQEWHYMLHGVVNNSNFIVGMAVLGILALKVQKVHGVFPKI